MCAATVADKVDPMRIVLLFGIEIFLDEVEEKQNIFCMGWMVEIIVLGWTSWGEAVVGYSYRIIGPGDKLSCQLNILRLILTGPDKIR